jgi:NAD(P)-dependent dehydrogenase (short-subunit alcohol dehydrogenase family)
MHADASAVERCKRDTGHNVCGTIDMKRTALIRTTAGVVAGAAAFAAVWRHASRLDLHGRTALVTGGSRGLGLAIARELGRLGAHVVLAARDAVELDAAREDLASRGVSVSVLVCDLADRGEGRRIVDQVIADRGRIDVLINNAGVIKVGPIEHMQTADFEEAMELHYWSPLQTMMAALPAMRAQGGGRIVNVSSIGGKIGVPHLVPYCASKFALTGLSTAMRGELVKDNILITTVSPGMMRTGSPFNAWFKGRHRDEFTWFAVSDSLPVLTTGAECAARQIVNACRCGDAELVVGWPFKLAIVAHAVMPGAVAATMTLGNGMLPAATGSDGDQAHSGWQSLSSWAPSRLTRLTERAAIENNELRRGQA